MTSPDRPARGAALRRRLASMPPGAVLAAGLRYAGRQARALGGACRDWVVPTGATAAGRRVTPLPLPLPLEALAAAQPRVLALATLAAEHRFDLLGSGWTRVAHGAAARGVEGHRYAMGEAVVTDPAGGWLRGRVPPSALPRARRLWRLVDPGYEPIDWQLDFKSGWRWSERTWHAAVDVSPAPGADIKVPWELARLQHLPMLAFAAALEGGGPAPGAPGRFAAEARNQILDFLATNPPRFGANWRCTMEVAIRAANCLVAHDLLVAGGADLGAAFEEAFAAAMLEHGRHIVAHLEYEPAFRSNHYLADVAGLLVVAAHLPRSAETDAWLAFGAQELLAEAAHQLGTDGSHFEASTSYHRLATEMVVYAALVCRSLGPARRRALDEYDPAALRTRPRLRPRREQEYDCGAPDLFPPWLWERVERAVEFALDATKPGGAIAQIGDNDSGRFLKLWPALRVMTVGEATARYANLAAYAGLPADAEYLDEDVLDHRHLGRVGAAVFGRPELAATAGDPESALVAAWLGGRTVRSYHRPGAAAAPAAAPPPDPPEALEAAVERLAARQGPPRVTRFEAAPGAPLTDGLRLARYPAFGLYVFRSPRLFLALRCGPAGQDGRGGHAHNDQLGVELAIDGVDLARDPGTYLYTPSAERRNQYRAAGAHFTPQRPGREQYDYGLGTEDLFRLRGDRARGACLCVATTGALGVHHGYGAPVYRAVRVGPTCVEVIDFDGETPGGAPPPFSPGYGKRLNDANG